MLTFVVLGNPGDEYKETRHNAGRLVFDMVLESLHLPNLVTSAKYGGLVSEGMLEGQEVRVLYPGTFMNHSGEVVKKVVEVDEVDKLVVVYDDVDIALGECKLSFDRGAGGHNGLTSVIEQLNSREFWRIRVGIAPQNAEGEAVRPTGDKLERYVMGHFSKRELERLLECQTAVVDMVRQLAKGEGEE